MDVKCEVKLDLKFDTPAGPLRLRYVVCLIIESDWPESMGEILLGRDVMMRLGYDPPRVFTDARSSHEEIDMKQDLQVCTSGDGGGQAKEKPGVLRVVLAASDVATAPEEVDLLPDEEQACFPDLAGRRSKTKKKYVRYYSARSRPSSLTDFPMSTWWLCASYSLSTKTCSGRDLAKTLTSICRLCAWT